MKITDLDRRRAIKFFPEFKKEHARYKRYKKLKSDKIFSFLTNFKKKWGYTFGAILHADEVAKQRKDSRAVKVVDCITEVPYTIAYKGRKTPSALKGEKLYLKINLKEKTETQLVEDFKEIIRPCIELLNKQIPEDAKKERNRKTDEPKGVWPIYGIYLKEQKNIIKTTRKYCKVSGNPSGYYAGDYSNNPKYFDEKYLKKVKTAIKNAEAIINAVRKEYDLK